MIDPDTLRAFAKYAKVDADLKPQQKRVVERIREQPGLVVAHGLGSGKTLTSIAAAEDQKGPTKVVAPAALVKNYGKELDKHAPEREADYDVQSLAKTVRSGVPPETGLLVVDEAHRLRDPATKGNQLMRKAKADKRLFLTATPVYNHPADAAALVNLAAGRTVLPAHRSDFEREYVHDEVIPPGFFDRLRGVKPGVVRKLKNEKKLREALRQWVDYHENAGGDDFPEREDVVVNVPVSKEHSKLLEGLMNDADPLFARKVRKNLPPSKQESRQLNAFLGAVRQASTSTSPYSTTLHETPKVDAAFKRLRDDLANNPDHRAVVYSNYLDAGLEPYRRKLEAENVPHALFTGKVPKRVRDQAIKDYNEGKLKALLVSSAGGEGLDLKGTRQIQILDPHWNEEKLKQVIGRGIRYKSHSHLPKDQRKVRVERYHAVEPEPGALKKLFGAKRPTSPDQYLRDVARRKDELNRQVVGLMQQEEA